MTNLKFDSF